MGGGVAAGGGLARLVGQCLRLGGLVVLAACTRETDADREAQARMDRETALARQAIEVINQRYMMHFNAGNGDSAAMVFAERGRAMWPNAPAAVGPEAITQAVGTLKTQSPELVLRTEEVAASGPLAVERGRYVLRWTPAGGTALVDSGKYLTRWHRIRGRWLIVDHIPNSDLPPIR